MALTGGTACRSSMPQAVCLNADQRCMFSMCRRVYELNEQAPGDKGCTVAGQDCELKTYIAMRAVGVLTRAKPDPDVTQKQGFSEQTI